MTTNVSVSIQEARSGTGVTIRIEVEPELSTTDLERALRPYCPADGPLYIGARRIDYWATVGDIGLVDGMIISAGAPGDSLFDRDTHPGVDALVVGGPDAGRVLALTPGTHIIGREGPNPNAIPDPEMSRRHAQVTVTSEGTHISDLGSMNETLIDGEPLIEPRALLGTEYIRLGRTAIRVVSPEAADAALVRTHEGTLTYNRRFRSATPAMPGAISFPTPPESEPPPKLNLIMLVLPALAGLVMVAIMRNPLYLTFALLGPITSLGSMFASKKMHRERQARLRAKYEDTHARRSAEMERARAFEMGLRRDLFPDPATLVRAARGPRHILWERRSTDPDFLELRVGLADQPSRLEVEGETAPRLGDLADIPVTVPLLEVSGIGVAGPDDLAIGIARNLIFQIAALHSPNDVKIVVISQDPKWSWTRWLPHVRSEADEDQLLIGASSTSIRARLDELEKLIAARRGSGAVHDNSARFGTRYVVLFDHPSKLDRSRVHRILGDGPEVGVHPICIEENEPQLPEEHIGASVALRGDRLHVRMRGHDPIEQVIEEVINPRHAELGARCLAPLRPEQTDHADLPPSVRLLDLMDLTDPDPDSIARGWAAHEGRCRATVGVSPGGALDVELDDRAPHGLVAGTSGAGKSEFLKTFLAGLAVTNHPDDLQFLLIDFKGGGDFRTLARLPHTIDLVTNTDDPDQAAVKRALDLLEAEVERRQRLVNEHGARDLATYRTARSSNPDLPVMGRILVVADEFAELATRRPELLDKMVSVARVGRAMGVHLLLATQRPAGAITPQIQANVPLRLCFRVLEGEADEVIGERGPEQISRNAAGRGFVRYGDEPAEEFQCARVANARPDVSAVQAPVTVETESWSALGIQKSGTTRRAEVPDPDTDLWTLVEAVIGASGVAGWTQNPVPWPKPLPVSIPFSPVTAALDDVLGRPNAAIGTRDDPRSQRHVPFGVTIGGGHVAVAGSPGSGRTTALRTIVTSLGYVLPPTSLHVHIIDMGGGGMRALSRYPHVGTLTDEPGIISRLLDRLEDEVEQRRSDFSTNGWSNLAEQWAAVQIDKRSHAIFLVIDGWESIEDLPGSGRTRSIGERIVKLLADGNSVGLQAAVAGDRSVGGRQIGRLMSHRLVLRFNDVSDYAYLDINERAVPRPHIGGRAMIPSGVGTADLMQLMHVGRDADGPSQAAALRGVAAHLNQGAFPAEKLPWKLAALPRQVAVESILAGDDRAPSGMECPIPIGVGGDEARPVWIDLAATGAGLAIAGPAGSGRSTALCAIALAAAAAGQDVITLTNGSSPLTDLDVSSTWCRTLPFSSAQRDDIDHWIQSRAVVLVDDASSVAKDDDTMSALVEAAAAGDIRLVAAGSTERWKEFATGWTAALQRAPSGVLLWPQSSLDGSAIGHPGSLSSELQFNRPAGRALYAVGGRLTLVQVPHH